MDQKNKSDAELEVTGVSRSGRVRKKSSKLMDFESPDEVDTRPKRLSGSGGSSGAGNVSGGGVANVSSVGSTGGPLAPGSTPHRPRHSSRSPISYSVKNEAQDSGSESDYYENTVGQADTMDSDSENDKVVQELPVKTYSKQPITPKPSNSVYLMEKTVKKKPAPKEQSETTPAPSKKGRGHASAYMLWAKHGARAGLVRKYPDMEFGEISKTLGKMWANVSYLEKYVWKKRAKKINDMNKMTEESIQAAQNNSGTPNQYPRNRQAVHSSSGNHSGGMYRVVGVGPAEIAAHLRLLGESLAIIGERLKEHEGQIAVSGSVSVLLDTLLCSLAPLVCLTAHIPAIAPPTNILQDTLDNIAYIMPGL